jgi:hypothetical protein
VVWFHETTLDDDLTNTASTTGTPSDSESNPIDLVAPVDSDSATVGVHEVKQEEVLPATGLSVGQFAIIGLVLFLLGTALATQVERRRVHVTPRPPPPRPWIVQPIDPASDRRQAPSRRLRL